MNINYRKQTQVIHETKCIGIHFVFRSNKILGEEEVLDEAIERFRIRHNLDKLLSVIEIVQKMIDYYNSTLRKGEYKREIISIFYIYNSKSYKKIKL